MILAIDPGNIQSAYCLIDTKTYKPNTYFVYKHLNKINNKVYIGITKQVPSKRWSNGNGYKECTNFYKAIKKYGWNNFDHIILEQNLTKEQALLKEEEYIKKYKSNLKKYGYNMQYGGNKTMTKEIKTKISQSLKNKKFSEEHKKKISLAQIGEKNHMYGKHLSVETKEKIRQANINKPSSGCFQSKKINQYELNGKYIKTWNTMGEIYRELGIKHCMISDCCRGKQKTSGGYIWKYSE